MDKVAGELKDRDKQFTQCEYNIYIGRTNSIVHKTSRHISQVILDRCCLCSGQSLNHKQQIIPELK